MRTRLLFSLGVLLLLTVVRYPGAPVASQAGAAGGHPPGKGPGQAAPQFDPVLFFGMNVYLTGLERSTSEATTLGDLAAQAGARWTREELSWANIERTGKGQFAWSTYDTRLGIAAANHLDVVGMLLTTPRWASSNPGASDYYWYEPVDFTDYFDFVRAAVGRWKSQIHVWEIWNEPNHQPTWNCLNNCNRAAHYAALLQGAYTAVKAVDPQARVLIGGLYIHDTNNEGMAFLDQVIAATGGAIPFDGLSIHTYMPDRIPESIDPQTVVQNFQYRLNLANGWITAHNGQPGEIWITEDGRSTCTGGAACPATQTWSEDQQASMLVRMYGIAAASPRVVHFDWFQFEDKFNNPANLYGGMAIVHDNYTIKPAWTAYKIAVQQLDGASFVGPGPQQIAAPASPQPASSNFVGFDYRFTRQGLMTDLVWRPTDSVTIDYPVLTTQVDVVDRDGATMRMTAHNGTIRLTISARPQYIVTTTAPPISPTPTRPPTATVTATPPGCGHFADVCSEFWAYTFIEDIAARDIVGGYTDGTFRPYNPATRGQLSKMIVLARGWPLLSPDTATFRDVPVGSTFFSFIETAKARAVISGYACGAGCLEFRPNNNVTRAQISKMIVTGFGWPTDTSGGPHFTDVSEGSPFYGPIETAVNHAVISGYADQTFRPSANVTRAQLSKMLYQALHQP